MSLAWPPVDRSLWLEVTDPAAAAAEAAEAAEEKAAEEAEVQELYA